MAPVRGDGGGRRLGPRTKPPAARTATTWRPPTTHLVGVQLLMTTFGYFANTRLSVGIRLHPDTAYYGYAYYAIYTHSSPSEQHSRHS
eukprot:scaffold91470_cov60-Phaeocystis_antarctica.AAC.1